MMPSSPTVPILSYRLVLLSITAALAVAQNPQPSAQQTGSNWPHAYPGMPAGDYSPEWQNYFQVTDSLPNVSWPLSRNWAGNIPVQRPGHPNNTLFFWAFESADGSLTANSSKPWGIWLNGGPGASSLAGLLFENGPIHILSNYSLVNNEFAWTNVADYVWIDNPVGTGYSTADADGHVTDSDQIATDFMGFLENFVKVFPGLATRPLYLSGESYAGVYIPYITKAYFEMDNPPVRLATIAIGDGAIISLQSLVNVPVISTLETYPQIIDYDPEVFEYFVEQSALCGYDLTLQYPQPAHFPAINAPMPSSNAALSGKSATRRSMMQSLRDIHWRDRLVSRSEDDYRSPSRHEHRRRTRDTWEKRDLAGRANGTIDPWYQCDLLSEMIDYAVNFTFPWSLGGEFDPYFIPDALSPEAPLDAIVFLNDFRTRSALHAPTSKDWAEITSGVFAPTNDSTNEFGDSGVEPMAFLTDLATNMTAHNVSVTIFSGNDDAVVPHFGSQGKQVAIQNTTFGGIQGFTRKPDTPWYNDAGDLAGVVHQERGWKYVLVEHAGHLVPYTNPASALTLAREFIFGSNPAGRVVTDSGDGGVTVVVGGEVPVLGDEILTGQAGIYYGQGATMSTYIFPSATVSAWDAFIASATASPA